MPYLWTHCIMDYYWLSVCARPNGNRTTRGYAKSQIANSLATGSSTCYGFHRAGQYIFVLWFFSFCVLLLSFFPCLFSAITDWMSTILPFMVWPLCKFRMQVWNMLHAVRWKYRTQKFAIWAPSYNFVGLYFHRIHRRQHAFTDDTGMSKHRLSPYNAYYHNW